MIIFGPCHTFETLAVVGCCKQITATSLHVQESFFLLEDGLELVLQNIFVVESCVCISDLAWYSDSPPGTFARYSQWFNMDF